MKKLFCMILVTVLTLCALIPVHAAVEHLDLADSFDGSATVSAVRSVSAGSIFFDGGTYAALKSNPFSDVSGDFTLNVWAYAEDMPAFARIIDFGTGETDAFGNPDNYVFLTLNSNYNSFYALPRFAIKQNGVEQSVTSSIGVVRNTWYAITVTKSGDRVKMYINGALAAEADGFTNSAAQDFAECYLGKSHWAADANYIGYIDELSVSAGAASEAEVLSLAGCGKPQLDTYLPMDAVSELGSNSGVMVNTSNAYLTKCFTFNGSSAYAMLGENPLSALRDSFTMSIWVKPRAKRTWSRVFDFGADTGNYAFLTLWAENDLPRFEINQGGTVQQVNSSVAVAADNLWHNITLTKNGQTAKIYIDGTLAGENYYMSNSVSVINTANNYLGKSQFSTDPLYYGYMDEMKVYSRALDAAEIYNLILGEPASLEAECAVFSDGEPVIALTGGEQRLSARAKLKNPTGSAISAQLIAAAYDADGHLCAVACSDAGELAPGGSADFEAELTADSPKRAAIYIWNSSKEQMPVFPAFCTAAYDGVEFPSLDDTSGTDEYAHDPSISKDPQSGKYYIYNSHTYYPAVSDDLIHWTTDPRGNMPLPESVAEHYSENARNASRTMWAPDILYEENDPDGMPYHLYYCYSGIGGVDGYFVNSSSIGMMKADNPEMNNAVDCGFIYSSSDDGVDNGKVNAIDQNVIVDAKTGEKYMNYGSFWRGIHMFKLNEAGDALALDADGSPDISGLNTDEAEYAKSFGAPILTRWCWAGVEGPYIIYNPETDYYYLFASYDYFTYNYTIRVGRSKNVTGPYLDANGKPMLAELSGTTEPWGYKLAGSYKFGGDNAYYAPGHNSVLNDNGEWYLVHHTRRIPHGGATLHVRKMLWTEDGWPLVSPERYSGERLQKIPEELVRGSWDFIRIGANTDAVAESETLTLMSNHTIAELDAEWSYDGDHTLTIDFGNGNTAEVSVLAAYDRDRGCPTLVLTGKDSRNIAVWGKKAVYQRVK